MNIILCVSILPEEWRSSWKIKGTEKFGKIKKAVAKKKCSSLFVYNGTIFTELWRRTLLLWSSADCG